MSLLADEVKELTELRNAFKEGKLSSGDVRVQIMTYSQTEKRARIILQAATLLARYGDKIKHEIAQTGLID